MALMVGSAAFVLWVPADNNVVQIIAGDNITITPDNGFGTVTINSTGVGGDGGIGDNNVTRILAGDNIVITPENGYGSVTITTRIENEIVQQIVAGENIIITPAGGTNVVTISAAGYDNTYNVTQIVAGDNVDIEPDNGYGTVTISASADLPDANVLRIVAGDNITIEPENGYGTVTITAIGENEVVNRLIAGTNITISPTSGVGIVTINSQMDDNNVNQIIAGENVSVSPENGHGQVTITATIDQRFEIVYENTLTAAATTIAPITGLDLDADGMYIVDMVIQNNTASDAGIYFDFNEDTTSTSYYLQWMRGDGNSVTALREQRRELGLNALGNGKTTVYHFTITRAYENGLVFMHGNVVYDESGSIQLFPYCRNWTTNANLTRIDISVNHANALGVGTRIRLCKVS